MQIKTRFKLEAVTTDDKTRAPLSAPYLHGDKLVATDGCALVAVKVQRDEGDADGYISVEAMEAARRWGSAKKTGGTYVEAPADALRVPCESGKCTLPRPVLGTFPNWEQIVPGAERREIRVSFDLELLRAVVEAAGGVKTRGQNVIVLGVPVDANGQREERAPLRIEVPANKREGEEVLALLMPCKE
jgi:hypothetical protein